MQLENLSDKELNSLHYELSQESFEIMSKGWSLIRFYEIERKMAALRREWLKRINL